MSESEYAGACSSNPLLSIERAAITRVAENHEKTSVERGGPQRAVRFRGHSTRCAPLVAARPACSSPTSRSLAARLEHSRDRAMIPRTFCESPVRSTMVRPTSSVRSVVARVDRSWIESMREEDPCRVQRAQARPRSRSRPSHSHSALALGDGPQCWVRFRGHSMRWAPHVAARPACSGPTSRGPTARLEHPPDRAMIPRTFGETGR